MVERLMIFDFQFNNDELEEEFHKFFYANNLLPLFTNEHRAGSITVTYSDARSVIVDSGKFTVKNGIRTEHGGKYHELLKEFSDYLLMAQDNKSYEEAVFKIIYEARSFQGLMNKIRRLMDYIDTIWEDRKFNTWNIVFYTKEVY